MITTNITQRAHIPHEPGEWMDLRRLSGTQLQVARDATVAASLKLVRDLGGDLFQAIQGQGRSAAPDGGAAAAGNPSAAYDRATVLQLGIAAWSYGDAVTSANVAALDEATMEWATREILAISLPKERSEGNERSGVSLAI